MSLDSSTAPTSIDASALINCLVSIGTRVNASGSAAVKSLRMNYLEARVVCAIRQPPARNAAALSKELGVDPAAISRTLKALKELGAVTASPERRLLRLTESGAKLYASVAVLVDEHDQRLMSPLTIRERIQLLEYLRRLKRALPALSAAIEEQNAMRSTTNDVETA
jgi:DNA-binding MarR family transcriptional regulator